MDETFRAGLRFNGCERFEAGKRGAMVLRMNQQLEIEDLRNHSAETVERLRHLLASGAPARPDPNREHFYEIANCSQVFYIHIAPSNGKVWLLATWLKDGQPAVSSTAAGDRPA
jgi:hypothetical protein